MFCPHCHNKIPDGSNICPLCYANLAGVKPQASAAPRAEGEAEHQAAPVRKSTKKSGKGKKAAYTKGSRGSKKNADSTPMIIAFGLIVILVIIIAMIVRSMFTAGDNTIKPQNTAVPAVQAQTTPQFMVFGAPTATPVVQQVVVTPTPAIEVTATPAPAQPATHKTLRKGDEGPEVQMMQLALTELGYLTSAADGNFGTGTQTAVKKFQADNGLDADGIAGRMTLEALYGKSSVTPIPDNTPTAAPGDIMDLPG